MRRETVDEQDLRVGKAKVTDEWDIRPFVHPRQKLRVWRRALDLVDELPEEEGVVLISQLAVLRTWQGHIRSSSAILTYLGRGQGAERRDIERPDESIIGQYSEILRGNEAK